MRHVRVNEKEKFSERAIPGRHLSYTEDIICCNSADEQDRRDGLVRASWLGKGLSSARSVTSIVLLLRGPSPIRSPESLRLPMMLKRVNEKHSIASMITQYAKRQPEAWGTECHSGALIRAVPRPAMQHSRSHL